MVATSQRPVGFCSFTSAQNTNAVLGFQNRLKFAVQLNYCKPIRCLSICAIVKYWCCDGLCADVRVQWCFLVSGLFRVFQHRSVTKDYFRLCVALLSEEIRVEKMRNLERRTRFGVDTRFLVIFPKPQQWFRDKRYPPACYNLWQLDSSGGNFSYRQQLSIWIFKLVWNY